MSIVLNEHEWAKEMIECRQLGKKPFDTIRRISRYYFDLGYKRRDVRRTIDRFVFQCGESPTSKRWSDKIDGAITMAQKNKAIIIDSIVITKPEMAIIESLVGSQVQKLAFTLLCLAKYRNAVSYSAARCQSGHGRHKVFAERGRSRGQRGRPGNMHQGRVE